MHEPAVLVVHPDQGIADEVASVLRDYGFPALALTNAVDALEHVENLRFDLAVLSTDLPVELGELLLDSSTRFLAIVLLGEPSNADGRFLTLPLPCEVRELVQTVSGAVTFCREMRFCIAMAWHDGWYGEAGYDHDSATEEESHAKLCRSLINTIHNVGSDQAMPS